MLLMLKLLSFFLLLSQEKNDYGTELMGKLVLNYDFYISYQ